MALSELAHCCADKCFWKISSDDINHLLWGSTPPPTLLELCFVLSSENKNKDLPLPQTLLQVKLESEVIGRERGQSCPRTFGRMSVVT